MRFADRFAQAIKPVRQLQQEVKHHGDVLQIMNTAITEQGQTIDRFASNMEELRQLLEEFRQHQSILSSGSGHTLEAASWMRTLLDKGADHMMLTHNFKYLLGQTDFWRDVLSDADLGVIKQALNELDDARRAEFISIICDC